MTTLLPGRGAILSIGMPGSSPVSICPPFNVSVRLLFLRQLNSRRREGIVPSQQQKASALPVWSSSAAETLVKGVVHTFDAIALAPLALWRLWGLQCQQKAMLQPQSFELNINLLYSFKEY